MSPGPRFRAAALLAAALLVGCTRRVRSPAPEPEDDPSAAWASLLDRAASPEGVDYALLAAERGPLDDYIAWIGAHGPHSDEIRESHEDRRLAFLINAYNAAVIYGVLAHQPLASVRDLRFGPWRPAGSAFFYGLRFRVDGEWTSLHVLEQQDIVARFQEPLVHAALNCASRGCPPVQWFDSLNLQAQLREAMRAYVRSDVGMRRTETGWAVSEIFHWYRDDFLDWSEAPTLCAWLAPYADGEAEGWLAAQGEACPLEVLPYDWSLNQHTATPGRVLPARQATPPGKARRPLQRKDREAASAGRDSGD